MGGKETLVVYFSVAIRFINIKILFSMVTLNVVVDIVVVGKKKGI